MFTFLGFVLIFCPYCLAVIVQWIGLYILFNNNVFISWYFCCKSIYLSSPGSNLVTNFKYYYYESILVSLLYIYNGQIRMFTFLWFVFFPMYCLAVYAQWIGSYIFINNIFLSWCFCPNKKLSIESRFKPFHQNQISL